MAEIIGFLQRLISGVGNDFYSYYLGALLVGEGKNPYLTASDFLGLKEKLGLDFLVGTGYSYPPFLAQLLSGPISYCSLPVALTVWMVVQALAFIVSYRILSRFTGGSAKRKLFSFFFFIPILGSVVNGQINGVILLLWVIYLFRSRDDSFIHGLILAVLTALKVYPVLLLISLFVGRRLRSLAGFAVTMGIYAVSAWELWLEYMVRVLPRLSLETDTYYLNQSLNGFVSKGSFLWGGNVLAQHIIIVTSAVCMVLWGAVQMYKFKMGRLQSELTVLMMAVLIAGKNSLWNMAPFVIIIVIFAAEYRHLAHLHRFLFLTAVAVTHVLFLAIIALGQSGQYTVAGLFSSSGTIAFLLLYYILLSVRIVFSPDKKTVQLKSFQIKI